jgi:glycosyltransferase involved in cell wall biosynthesis
MADKKILSVIIPVFNEEKTIEEILDKVRNVQLPLDKELVIVNDGSKDSSPDIIKKWMGANSSVSGMTIEYIDKANAGKGSAVREGIAKSTGDIVIIQDGDLEYDPEDYMLCATPILEGKAKVVYGSRELANERRTYSYASFFMGGLAVTNFCNLLFWSELTDEPTCYKTFDGPLIRALLFKGDKFEWEPEITAKLLRLGYEIKEVGIKYFPRKVEEGKKINWKDGLLAFWTLLIWRFAPIGKEMKKLSTLPGEELFCLKNLNRKKILWIIFIMALLIRLFMALPGLTSSPEKTFCRPDSASYILPAAAIAENGKYETSANSGIPAVLRPPGFSAFLAPFFLFNGENLILPVLTLCAISALTCIIVFRMGRLFGGFAAGIISAVLFAFNVTGIGNAPLILTDTLYTFLVALQLYFFIRYFLCRKRILYLLFSVALAGIGTLVRPIGMLWIIPCVFLIMIMFKEPLKNRIGHALAATVVFCVILFPWMGRNKYLGAGFKLGTNIGDTLYFHNCSVLISKTSQDGFSSDEIRQKLMDEASREFTENPDKYPDEESKLNYKIKKAKEIIFENPIAYFKLHFRPFIMLPDIPSFFEVLGFTQSGKGTFSVLNQKGFIAAVKHYFGGKLWLLLIVAPLMLIVAFTYLFFAIQLLKWIVQRKWFLFFVFLAFVEYFLLLPGPISMPRYHLPALPFICVMAGMSICWLLNLRKARS